MSKGGAVQQVFRPLIGAVEHAEWPKEVALHCAAKIAGADFETSFVFVALGAIDAAGEVCQDGLEVKVAFSGVKEFFAGIEVDLQRVSGGTPVLKSARMREDVAGGDLVEARIVFDETPGNVLGKRCVEGQCAVIDLLENGVSENGFADR